MERARRHMVAGLVTVGLVFAGLGITVLIANRHPTAAAVAHPRSALATPARPSERVAHVSAGTHRQARGTHHNGPRRSARVSAVVHDPVPRSVAIPALSVAAPVTERVSVLSSGPERGLLSAPANYHDLGWYRHGTTGVLVMVGHVGFASGAGPLAYVGSLSRGDSVVVHYWHQTTTYRVIDIDHVRKGGLSPSWFGPRYGGDVMLITCDYQSAFRNGHFANNVFVVAAPV